MGMCYSYLFLKRKEEGEEAILRVEQDFHTQIIPTQIKGFVQPPPPSN